MQPPFFDGKVELGMLKTLPSHQLEALKEFIIGFEKEELIKLIDNELRSRKPKVIKMRPKNTDK